jgi:hypothetical protein
MNKNLCPLCRASMRIWALDARHSPTPGHRYICVRTAISFRDECCHTDRERYDALVDKMAGTSAGKESFWRAIEAIKNRHGGLVPPATISVQQSVPPASSKRINLVSLPAVGEHTDSPACRRVTEPETVLQKQTKETKAGSFLASLASVKFGRAA